MKRGESVKVGYLPHDAQLFTSIERFYGLYGLGLGWIKVNSFTMYNESQKFSRRNTKDTFQGVHYELIKEFPQIIYMVMDFLDVLRNRRSSRQLCHMS